MKINWNKKYTTIALYVCAVLAVTIIAVAICVYLPNIFAGIGSFFSMISPIFTGLALAYLISPLLSFVERIIMKFVDRKKRTPYIKRIICLFVTYLLLVCIITLFGFLIIPELVKNFDSISVNISTNINNLYEWVRTFLKKTFNITIGESGSGIAALSEFIVGFLADIGSKIGRWMLNASIGLFLSFFILLHSERLRQGTKKLLAAVFPAKVFNGTMKITHMADKVFGRFFVGKIFDSLIVGVIMLAVLGFFQLPFLPAVFHMPYFLLIAAVICITNIIPYIGPILGAIPCVLLVFIDSDGGFARAVILLIVIVAVQILDGNVIGPKILGKTIGISSLWVVISIIVMGSFFGIFGMFIAVPLFTVIYNLVKEYTNRRLEKKNLSTDTKDYEQSEDDTAADFPWVEKEAPTPDPALLSDILEEGSMEGLERKHRTSEKKLDEEGDEK